MMIKVFTVDKDGKVLLTPEEIKSMLDEAYWEGYTANKSYTYISPTLNQTPYSITYNGKSCEVHAQN